MGEQAVNRFVFDDMGCEHPPDKEGTDARGPLSAPPPLDLGAQVYSAVDALAGKEPAGMPPAKNLPEKTNSAAT